MATTINNSANISYRYGANIDYATSNIATTELAESHSLKATKISNNTNWRPSENITYAIRIENDGSEPLYAVSVQDNLGGNHDRLLIYVANSVKMFRNGIFTDVTPTSTEPLTLVIPGTLQPGEIVTFTYIAKVRSDIDTSINEVTNEVTVAGHETSEAGPVITVSPAPTITISKANYAEVRIEKTVDKTSISVGERLTYTFRLENYGNIEATNVVIEDNLPVNFTIESITSETAGVTTTFETTDYSLNADNKLILPTSTTKTLSVPANTPAGSGLTIVTIIGTIDA